MQDNPEMKKQEQEQILELGSDITKSSKGNIYTLTIIGQVEGHMNAPENVKTTKYEHVLPLLASIEESDDIDGLLLLAIAFSADGASGLSIFRAMFNSVSLADLIFSSSSCGKGLPSSAFAFSI